MTAGEIADGREQRAGAGLALRWLPPLLLVIAIIGVVAVLPSVSGDESGREWYRGQLGGSPIYRVNVIFARLVPFIAGGALALALLQRQRLNAAERHTATS